jgi:hypothetical protein
MRVHTHHPRFVWPINSAVKMYNLLCSMDACIGSTRAVDDNIAISNQR